MSLTVPADIHLFLAFFHSLISTFISMSIGQKIKGRAVTRRLLPADNMENVSDPFAINFYSIDFPPFQSNSTGHSPAVNEAAT